MLKRQDFVILAVLFALAIGAAFGQNRYIRKPPLTETQSRVQDIIATHIDALRNDQSAIWQTLHAAPAKDTPITPRELATIAQAREFSFIGDPQRVGASRTRQQIVEITTPNGRNLHILYELRPLKRQSYIRSATRHDTLDWRIINIIIRRAKSLNI